MKVVLSALSLTLAAVSKVYLQCVCSAIKGNEALIYGRNLDEPGKPNTM